MAIVSILTSISIAVVDFLIRGRMSVVVNVYGFILPLAACLPYLAFNANGYLKKRVSKNWLKYVNYFVFALIVVNAPGSLYFHDAGIQYDRLLHFAAALISFLLIGLLIFPFFSKKENFSKAVFILLISLMVFFGLFAWEGIQYSSDAIFGSKVFFDVKQDIAVDFLEDILFGFLGLVVSVVYLNYSFDKILLKIKSV